MPGTTDTGNHCDDCTTVISLPFSVTLYDQTFASATVGSNGIFAFGTNNNAFAGSCLPVPTVTYETMPFYRDQRTDCTVVVSSPLPPVPLLTAFSGWSIAPSTLAKPVPRRRSIMK